MASDHPNSTTFVQADPSNFRAVVQRLTGATPTTPPTRTSGFKLHERRQTTARKLEITLNNRFHYNQFGMMSPSSARQAMMTSSSPVSTLDHVYGRGNSSPKTPVEGEEERAIAEKGFYLHPSPVNTPRRYEPELLVLFPLHSPKNDPSSS
uniref:VQ motif-containing protein 19-like n=1 Tax=Erigeron canadensis TaxID=72917 RepID=UPI001CB939F9|nr:VQ motif-containing protein 19-like [Erigeron canadensis]